MGRHIKASDVPETVINAATLEHTPLCAGVGTNFNCSVFADYAKTSACFVVPPLPKSASRFSGALRLSEKHFYRNCRCGSLQATTRECNNDTPALNASQHWAAGLNQCRGEIPVERSRRRLNLL